MNFNQSVFGDETLHNKIAELDIDISSFSQEENILKNLEELSQGHTWQNFRSESNFTLITKHFSFGERKVYVPNNEKSLENLQLSRTFGFRKNCTIRSVVEEFYSVIHKPNPSDVLRYQELNTILSKIKGDFQNLKSHIDDEREISMLETAFINHPKKFVDLGFRSPGSLELYRKDGYEVSGYEINDLSVNVTRKLGFNVENKNIATDSSIVIPTNCVVGCYQVLETTDDPLAALKNLKSISKNN